MEDVLRWFVERPDNSRWVQTAQYRDGDSWRWVDKFNVIHVEACCCAFVPLNVRISRHNKLEQNFLPTSELAAWSTVMIFEKKDKQINKQSLSMMLKQMARGKICSYVALVRHSYGSRYNISIDLDWFLVQILSLVTVQRTVLNLRGGENIQNFRSRRMVLTLVFTYDLNWALSLLQSIWQ